MSCLCCIAPYPSLYCQSLKWNCVVWCPHPLGSLDNLHGLALCRCFHAVLGRSPIWQCFPSQTSAITPPMPWRQTGTAHLLHVSCPALLSWLLGSDSCGPAAFHSLHQASIATLVMGSSFCAPNYFLLPACQWLMSVEMQRQRASQQSTSIIAKHSGKLSHCTMPASGVDFKVRWLVDVNSTYICLLLLPHQVQIGKGSAIDTWRLLFFIAAAMWAQKMASLLFTSAQFGMMNQGHLQQGMRFSYLIWQIPHLWLLFWIWDLCLKNCWPSRVSSAMSSSLCFSLL